MSIDIIAIVCLRAVTSFRLVALLADGTLHMNDHRGTCKITANYMFYYKL